MDFHLVVIIERRVSLLALVRPVPWPLRLLAPLWPFREFLHSMLEDMLLFAPIRCRRPPARPDLLDQVGGALRRGHAVDPRNKPGTPHRWKIHHVDGVALIHKV